MRTTHPTSAVLAALVLALATSACDDPTAPEAGPRTIAKLPRDLSVVEEEVVARTNAFALDLLREVHAANPNRPNIFLSPFSASTALGMALNGAAGETFDSIGPRSLRRPRRGGDQSGLSRPDRVVLRSTPRSSWVSRTPPGRDRITPSSAITSGPSRRGSTPRPANWTSTIPPPSMSSTAGLPTRRKDASGRRSARSRRTTSSSSSTPSTSRGSGPTSSIRRALRRVPSPSPTARRSRSTGCAASCRPASPCSTM